MKPIDWTDRIDVEGAINRTLELSEDFHNIFTPFELCEEVLGKVVENLDPSSETKWLVIANLEFVYTLKVLLESRKIGMDNVWFATPCKVKKVVAERLGVKNFVEYSYDNIKKGFEEVEMKFDVIVGNPPYQDSNSKNTHALWPKFVKLAFSKWTKTNGIVAMITPRTWTTNDSYDTLFVPRQPIAINIDECGKHFPGVGSTFSWFIVQNSPKTKKPFEVTTSNGSITLTQWPSTGLGCTSATAIGILTKTSQHESFTPYTSYVYHTDRFTKKDTGVSKTKTDQHTVPILHKRSADGTDTVFYSDKTDQKQHGVPRVVFSLWVGRWNDMFVTDSIHTCQQFIQIATNTLHEAHRLRSVLCSKLYRFIMLNTVSGGSLTMKSTSHFPSVNLSRSWTDEELYEHFNLTEKEIKLIEETVK